ncbi:hypothetical protein CPB83DRAFT_150456 [Crepidotus variabilis]|uniref:Ubiquitin-like domain-containing protein n=1 Tax=Crepidotus variabilis TaxID=179855 RepID=A0A9P6E3Y4_9AGAR|nr:hypothetical protein CPB83DRAFT_150456 [Crepidotus variabilis]
MDNQSTLQPKFGPVFTLLQAQRQTWRIEPRNAGSIVLASLTKAQEPRLIQPLSIDDLESRLGHYKQSSRRKIQLEIEEERVQRIRNRLYQEEERIHAMRMAGINLFQGANNVSISGNSSFNIYWGSMGSGTWITFVDASGRSYPVPEYLTSSHGTFLDAINLIFRQDNEVARIQRRFVENHMYELCIDQGNQIILVNAQEGWSKVERNTKIVMRIPIWQIPEEIDSKKMYRCPSLHCNLWIEGPARDAPAIIDCKGCNSRFQISDLLKEETDEILIPPSSPNDIGAIPFFQNFHLQSVTTGIEHSELGYLRFRSTAELANLTYAAGHFQRSIQLIPEGHSDMPIHLGNLGDLFQQRYRQTGDMADLGCAIDLAEKAIQLTPEDHFDMPFHLHHLGIALQLRFNQSGDLADLTSAIEHHQEAVQLTPEGHSDLPLYFDNMGCILSVSRRLKSDRNSSSWKTGDSVLFSKV